MVFVTSRKSWTLRLTVCAAVLALAAGRAEAGLIIVNGSFEEPLTTGSTAVTGWKVVGPQVAVVNTSYNTNSITFQAQDGNQWLDLSGLFANSTADGVLMVGVLGLPIARARRRRGPVGPWWGRMAFGFLRLNSPCPPSEQHRTRPRSTCRPEVELLENRALPSTGYLFVPSFDTDAVLRYNETTGAFVDVFVTHKSGGLNQPNSVIVGPDHNLYVTSGFFGGPGQLKAVLRYDGTTGAFIDNFAQSSIINSPALYPFRARRQSLRRRRN